MSTNEFHCAACSATSTGPFKIGPHEVAPACRNDACPTMWWNRSLFEQVKSIVSISDLELGAIIGAALK